MQSVDLTPQMKHLPLRVPKFVIFHPAMILKTDTIQKQPPEVFYTKKFLKNLKKLPGKHLYQGLFLVNFQACAYNFIKRETLTQVFSCEFCEIFKNIFFTGHSTTASDNLGKTLVVRSSQLRSRCLSHRQRLYKYLSLYSFSNYNILITSQVGQH